MSERSIAQEQPARTDQSHRLWLVRHGATAWNLERRYQGQSDIPLAPLGCAQARWVGRRLRLEHIRAIYSSDLQRTQETATIIAQHCSFHQPIALSSAWREMSFGEWEGLTYAQIADQYQQHLGFFSNPIDHSPPGGEPLSQLVQRVRTAFTQLVQDIAKQADSTKGGDTVLVSHAGALRALLCSLLGIPLERQYQLRFDQGSLSAIEFQPVAEDVAATVSLVLFNVRPLTRSLGTP